MYCVSLWIYAADIDSSFTVKWQNEAWGAGGLFPAGPPWNMVGPYDFDNDGYGDFVVASAYAGQYCNGVYHYEATDNDSIVVQWVYTFYDLSCTYDAYSSVAVGDIDGDNNPEILSLVDTSPGVSGQKGLQIFEWDSDSLSFLSSPTYTWDMGLDSVWEAGQILVAELDGDATQEIIVSVMDGPWSELGSGGSSRLMIFELDSIIDDSAIFNIEYEDNVWTNWSGYNISTGDLDNDGLMEIYTVAYEYYHIIVHENSGEDQYEYQTDFYVCSQQYERGNQSIIVTDLDENGTNELFGVTSGTNTLAGDLLTPGLFFAVQGVDDVSTLSYGNFNFFASYIGGLRQINTGDADGDGKPNLYLAGHYNEAVYDWEFNGDDPLAVESFSERIIFMDDTTDNYTPGNDQGKVRVAKLFSGDLDNDGYGDLVLSSASFAADKPQLFMIEHDGTLETDYNNHTIPNHASISQNFPNPFNPETQFSYTLNESGTIFLGIYDIMGKLIYTVYDGFQRAGNHNVLWIGFDQENRPVSSGVYFYRLVTQSNTISKKMVLAK
tara:strand:+ start:84 stop:1733 length:1650 start_codon:yes stop_codon:yes gene_type:complete